MNFYNAASGGSGPDSGGSSNGGNVAGSVAGGPASAGGSSGASGLSGGSSGGSSAGGSSAGGSPAGGSPVGGSSVGGSSAGDGASGGDSGVAGGGSDAPCSNAVDPLGMSAILGTTGPVCIRVKDDIAGWGCSNFEGRTVKVNRKTVTCDEEPLPDKVDGAYYFDISAGKNDYASFYWF